MKRKIVLFLTLFLVILNTGLFPASAATQKEVSKETQVKQVKKKPQEITIKQRKIDEGVYRFSFNGNVKSFNEDDKADAFLKELVTFKKEHSQEKVTGYQPVFKNNPLSIDSYIVSTEKKVKNWTNIAAILGILVGVCTFLYTIVNNRKTLFVSNITSERVKWMGQLKDYVSEFVSLTTIYNEKPILKDRKDIGELLDKIVYTKAKILLHLNYRGEPDNNIIEVVNRIVINIMKLYENINLLSQDSEVKKMHFLIENKQKINERAEKKIEEKVKEQTSKTLIPDAEFIQDILNESINEEIKDYNSKFAHEFKNFSEELKGDTDILISLTQAYLKEEWNRVKKEAEKGNFSKGNVLSSFSKKFPK